MRVQVSGFEIMQGCVASFSGFLVHDSLVGDSELRFGVQGPSPCRT
jgi:hypothetical protein